MHKYFMYSPTAVLDSLSIVSAYLQTPHAQTEHGFESQLPTAMFAQIKRSQIHNTESTHCPVIHKSNYITLKWYLVLNQ